MQILRGTSAVVSWLPQDANGEPATVDPGAVTVGVTSSAGTVVVAAGTATGGTLVAARTYTIPVSATAVLDLLTVTFTAGGVTVGSVPVEVVGGYYFTIAELRATETALADPADVTTATLISIRNEVETSFESWTNVAMVPRFSVVDAYGHGSCGLLLEPATFYPRAVRWARYWTSDTAYTALTSTELLSVRVTPHGTVERSAGWYGRWQLGVEHGWDAPPPDGKRMALLYARICALRSMRGISANAQSYTTPDGQTVSYDPDVKPTNYKVINEFLLRQGIDHSLPGIG